MRRLNISLKHQFITLFLLSIIIPILIILWLMPSYYNEKNKEQMITLTKSSLASLASTLSTYLTDLNTYTISPYFNNKTLSAMKLKVSGEYDTLSPYEKLLLDREFNSIGERFVTEGREEILSTLLICLDGSVAANSRHDGTLISNYNFKSQDWYQATLRANGKNVFTGKHRYDYFTYPSATNVFSISRLIKDPNRQTPLGVIIASADVKIFDKLTRSINLGVMSALTILDENNHIIYSTKDLPYELVEQLLSGEDHLHYKNDTYLEITHPIESSPWKLKVLVSQNDLNSKTYFIYWIAVGFAFFTLVTISIGFLKFSRLVLDPFSQMKRLMTYVKEGNLKHRFVSKDTNEVSALGLALNDMMTQLDILIEKEYKTALLARTAEYQSLCSQIQPHFLFNTLNGFIGLNRLGEKETLEKAILSLTSMLRYSLRSEDCVTLEKDFNFVSNYLDLQKLRFEDRFDVALSYDPSLKDLLIPKLLLQPFVENSIIHGIEPSDDFCHIKVCGELTFIHNTTYVQITIKDTGIGFDAKTNPSHIGLSNSKGRLLFMYPNASLEIHSTLGCGTAVNIIIPMEEVTYVKSSHL